VKEKQIHCSLFHSITYRNKFACVNNIWAGTSVSHPIFTPISNNTDVNVWTHYLSNFLIQIVWIQAVLMFTYCKNHDEKKRFPYLLLSFTCEIKQRYSKKNDNR
jgi:hypothetical protein